jgi:hypothetical protein
MTVELISRLTCPKCGYVANETIPANACVCIYECRNRGALLKPKSGDCCVFCSYGTVPCPPVQKTRRGGYSTRPSTH